MKGGIYHSDIEKAFKDLPGIENILQKYDNVTYHIQFYMVKKEIFTMYDNIITSLMFNYTSPNRDENNDIIDDGYNPYVLIEQLNNKLLYNNAIIIAETGVTNTTNIESLKMVTHTPSNSPTYATTTIEFDMVLSELNSTSLTNKIALASRLAGYNTYCNQPCFITITFTGYDKSTGKPIKRIVLDNGLQRLTYRLIICDIKSETDSNKITHSLKLYPYFYNSISKDVNYITNIGSIKIDRHDLFGQTIEKFEKKVNENLYYQYTKDVMDNVYKGQKPLEIFIGDGMSDVKSHYKIDTDNNILKNRMWWKKNLSILEPLNQVGEVVNNAISFLGRNETLTPSEKDTIKNVLEEIFSLYDLQKDGYRIIIKYGTKNIGDYKNKTYYKHTIIIDKVKVPGLEDMMKYGVGRQDGEYVKNAKKHQENYLNQVKSMNLLCKKYYWSYSGKNTNVLSYKTDESRLWYLNIGITDLYAVGKNLPKQSDIKDYYEKSPRTDMFVDIEKILNNGIDANKGKTVYIDDLYYSYVKGLKKEDADKILSTSIYKIPEGNSFLSEIPNISSVVNTDDKKEPSISNENKQILEKKIIYKLGMENIFQYTGQKITCDLDIIGDPYWLIFGSVADGVSNETVLPHFLMFKKGFHEIDSHDSYKEDKLMEINTLYMATKIISTFENGVFKQRLTGYVATPFLQSTKYYDENTTMTSNIKTTNRATR